jgi:cation:H+ antiporter
MLWNDRLDRWEGALLFACLLAYTFFSIRSSRRETHMATGVRPGHATAWSITLVTGGLLMLAAGAHWFVLGAVHVALHFGLSMFVVGLTVVAIGTSLPEIATSVVAGIKGEGDIAVGNAVGSNIFNLFCILGLTALFFEIDGSGLSGVDLAAMVVLALAALPIMRNGFAIRRWEGALLLVAYVGYLAYLLQRS